MHLSRRHIDASPTKFVILSAPRSGSNLLCTLLNSHPDVLCHHEIYNPNGVFIAQSLRHSSFQIGNLEQRNADPVNFLQLVWSLNLGHAFTGFKMTHRQQADVFKTICEDDSIHKIVLRRRAKIKTYVSQLIAEQTGVWEEYCSDSQRPQPSPVHVSLSGLLESIKYNHKYYQELETSLRGRRTDVLYEEVLDIDTQRRLLRELGLSLRPLRATSRRQNPRSLKHLIANMRSLKTQLARLDHNTELLAELNQT